ncbi:MAG TPA: PorV/PorQ family protein [Flavobacteriales bacterium]|nr:PorV/PorQ family protein [Flavobacteriales bacterium]
MKTKYISMLLLASCFTGQVFAGNEDRVGSAGATELLLNPWSRSLGLASANVATVSGLEGAFVNIGGLAMLTKMELVAVRTNLYGKDGVKVNSLGFGQKIGESSVIGLTYTGFNFGDIPVTTVDNPEGLGTTFSPRYTLLGLAYARTFSNSIYGGIQLKIINESIANAKSTGVAFDAGIKYVTGEKDQIKFGINLKNVGPPMSYSGDGFAVTSTFDAVTPVNDFSSTTEIRSAKFELPSQVNISFGYDFLFGETGKLTTVGCYTSNSFSKDNYRLGLEYVHSIKKAQFGVRAGYNYEKGIFKTDTRTTAFSGPAAGLSVDFGKDAKAGTLIGIDYTFQPVSYMASTHTVGVRITLK